jgi:hypothetical protein
LVPLPQANLTAQPAQRVMKDVRTSEVNKLRALRVAIDRYNRARAKLARKAKP